MYILLQILRKLIILTIFSIVLPSSSLVAAEDDKMMQKLFKLHSTLMIKGNVESMVKLGIMYEQGEGIPKNRKKARQLFKQAADLGNKSAIELLKNVNSIKIMDRLKRHTSTIVVPNVKTKHDSKPPMVEKQWEIDKDLARESAEEKAAENQKDQHRAQQADREEHLTPEKQNKLDQELLKVQQARADWERERAKALKVDHELALAAAEKRAREIRKQADREKQQQKAEKLLAEKTKAAQLKKSQQKTFSSNPCNTPAAKFMSTCY